MKKFFLIIMLALTGTIVNSQNCFWGKSAIIGSTNDDRQTITADASGNIYATGGFNNPTIVFGGNTLNNSSSGTDDYYIVKYNNDGTVAWANRAGGDIHDLGTGIVADNLGYIYVTGYFRSDSIIFGSEILLNPNPGYSQIFIVKYDDSGNEIWAKTASAGSRTSDDNSLDIGLDANGNIYISGIFYSSSIKFGAITLTNCNSTGSDIFLAKYDASGNAVWARRTGGRNYDQCAGETIDSDGNVFLAGSFPGDTIKFNDDTLVVPGLFVAKYDVDGNEIWAQSSTNGAGSDALGIAADASGNVIVTGYFEDTFLGFESDTVYNSFFAGKEIYIVKFDASGNMMWVKAQGGKKDDMSYDVVTDIDENIYITGFFGDTAYFGNDTLINSMPGTYNQNLFISKYDGTGNGLWTANAQGSNRGNKIFVNASGEICVTGYYSNAVMHLNNITFPNTPGDNIFIARAYDFNAFISSITDAGCHGDSTGAATVDLTGGWSPFTYLWSTGDAGTNVSGLAAGDYTVTVTDNNLCIQNPTATISEPMLEIPAICMVTVDSMSMYNIIIWDKTVYTTIDTFMVCREISTNNYQPIARIPYDASSQFIDTVRTLYFPNTGNPNEGTYRYKIMLHDTCGKYGELSPYHNTIYFLNNAGTFYWTQPYTIENGANPVASYVLMRDDYSTGDWNDVTSVAGTQQVINDPLFSIYENTASWRVKTQWSISCNVTLKDETSFSTSLSNIFSNYISVGTNENSMDQLVNIYPNPADDRIEITFPLNSQIEILNIEGQIILSISGNNTHAIIDVSVLPFGMYIVKCITEKKVIVKKLIIK